MAHFAKIVDTKVVEVIVVHNNEAPTEAEGKAFIASCGFDGEWVQTSYNANFRNKFAGIGDTYDAKLDKFVPPPAPKPLEPSE